MSFRGGLLLGLVSGWARVERGDSSGVHSGGCYQPDSDARRSSDDVRGSFRRGRPVPRPCERCQSSGLSGSLCGTQVFVGDEPAGLLYVSRQQINFQVPKDSPNDGAADMSVVYDGQWSKPLTMQAGFPKMTIRLDQPAYTDMPVWLKVEFGSAVRGRIRYPSLIGPAGFGCSEVEVRREGKLLTRLPGSSWNRIGPIGLSGPPCGGYGRRRRIGLENRLPLHLLYRFDEPGMYEVRLTLRKLPFARVNRRPSFSQSGLPSRCWRRIIISARSGWRMCGTGIRWMPRSSCRTCCRACWACPMKNLWRS